MADPSPTAFDLLEQHKENITPLASGRSASGLVAQLTPLSANPQLARSENYARQQEFEEELKTARDEDDPLEVWLRYINWTVAAFPSGHSAESGLLQLLERATKEFANDSDYKNDPRYLRLWIQYAKDFSDAPREIFAYLTRHDIGQKRALFYEEYAALLESTGRKNQAAEVFQTGIENDAKPVERLERKYQEFLERLEASPAGETDPGSPARPAARPALAMKSVLGSETTDSVPDPQQPQPTPAPAKPRKQKMAIFSDADGDASSIKGGEKASEGWENVGTLQQRKKENFHAPKPWAGETLKQSSKPAKSERLMVFRDDSVREPHVLAPFCDVMVVSVSISHTFLNRTNRTRLSFGSIIQSSKVNAPEPMLNRRSDNIAVDIESLYPEGQEGDEFCFEELRAIKRGFYGKDWNLQREVELEEQTELLQLSLGRPMPTGSRTPIRVKTVLSPSPNKGKIKRKGRGTANAEPTMTFHTRAATDEIYDLFNQPLNTPAEDDESGDSDDSDPRSEDEDYTMASQIGSLSGVHNHGGEDDEEEDEGGSVHSDWSDFTIQKMVGTAKDQTRNTTPNELEKPILRPQWAAPHENMFKDVKSAQTEPKKKLCIFKDEDSENEPQTQARKIQIPPPPEDFDPPKLPYHLAKEQSNMQSRLPYMTPIVERTESLPPTTLRSRHALAAKTPCRSRVPPAFEGGQLLEESDDYDDTAATFPLHAPKQPALSRPTSVANIPVVKQGPIIADILCNPMDAGLRKTIFEKLNPPLEAYNGFYRDASRSGRGNDIRKFCKAISKRDGDKATLNIPTPPTLEFITGDGGSSFTLKRELGKGAFAPVFLVENNLVADAEDDDKNQPADGRLQGRRVYEALKMEDPPTPWEFYIMRQIMLRLKNKRPLESVVQAHEMHLFADEGFLIIDYKDQGTVLDLVNTARSEPTAPPSTAMDELLVMFLAVELLRTVEGFHDAGIIHGDLKPDNCLVRFETIPDAEWKAKYSPDGSGGWARKGVSFIDFGRGIDMTLFSPSVQFVADWKTDQQDCAEMREMRPWTYQVDYHGLAAIIYTMLFGKYIETVADKSPFVGGSTKHYKIATPLKRYWQQDIWADTFDVLLNPLQHTHDEDLKSMPILEGLAKCRLRMEQHLVAHGDRGIGLKNIIRKAEATVTRKR